MSTFFVLSIQPQLSQNSIQDAALDSDYPASYITGLRHIQFFAIGLSMNPVVKKITILRAALYRVDMIHIMKMAVLQGNSYGSPRASPWCRNLAMISASR